MILRPHHPRPRRRALRHPRRRRHRPRPRRRHRRRRAAAAFALDREVALPQAYPPLGARGRVTGLRRNLGRRVSGDEPLDHCETT